MSKLYMVGTPIGNLQDITFRAVEVLRSVHCIACEDTRRSLKLLNAYDIHKPLISCHSYNEAAASERVLALLRSGKTLAYICDAGTPGISDPGTRLVRSVRSEGFPVIPIPGPSALTAILSISGFSTQGVIFSGFLSPKKNRRKNQLKDLYKTQKSFIIYESPFRILNFLCDCIEIESENIDKRNILCGRELTKSHEEVIEGTAEVIYTILKQYQSVKGEFVLLVSGGQ